MVKCQYDFFPEISENYRFSRCEPAKCKVIFAYPVSSAQPTRPPRWHQELSYNGTKYWANEDGNVTWSDPTKGPLTGTKPPQWRQKVSYNGTRYWANEYGNVTWSDPTKGSLSGTKPP